MCGFSASARSMIGDFLIELALGHPDLTNLFQQVVEVFFREYASAVLQTVTVHGPTLDGVILDNAVSPLAELDGPVIVDLEANCNDHL